MNLRQCVLDALRTGKQIANISSHYSISEHEILQIVANEMSAKLPEHLVEYLKLQDMEALWAEHSNHALMLPSEAWSRLHAQRERFHLVMEKEVRRVTGVNDHPEIRPMVESFRGVLAAVVDDVPAPPKIKKSKGKKR